MAGTIVDVTLFPLDTIKTRLQSSKGFLKSGGLGGIYRGVLSAALGSFPGGKMCLIFFHFSFYNKGQYDKEPLYSPGKT